MGIFRKTIICCVLWGSFLSATFGLDVAEIPAERVVCTHHLQKEEYSLSRFTEPGFEVVVEEPVIMGRLFYEVWHQGIAARPTVRVNTIKAGVMEPSYPSLNDAFYHTYAWADETRDNHRFALDYGSWMPAVCMIDGSFFKEGSNRISLESGVDGMRFRKLELELLEKNGAEDVVHDYRGRGENKPEGLPLAYWSEEPFTEEENQISQLQYLVRRDLTSIKSQLRKLELLSRSSIAKKPAVTPRRVSSKFVMNQALESISFTDLEGVAVDTTKLKGKVVLIDFWATWCGPCVGQLPHLKRLYSAYHDKGLEIIGISLDKDKDALVKFVQDKKILWPHHFDGLGWKNKWAVHFDVKSIPRTVLLDREGRVVAINPRGSDLDDAIKAAIDAKH